MLETIPLPVLILMETSIMLAAGGAFLRWQLVRARRDCVALTNQLSMLRRREVTTFLTRELVHTRDIAGRPLTRSPEAARMLRLRQQWLEAEQNALTAEGEEKSDYAAIERIAPLLLQIVDGQGAATITRRHRSGRSQASMGNPRELLSRAKTVIALQKDIIAGLKVSVASTAGTESTADTATAWGDSLALAHQNTEQQHSSLVKLERGLDAAQVQYHHASNELQQAKAAGQIEPPSAQSLLIIQSPDSINVESAKAFLDEMEEAHRESTAELRLMRDTNARQRKLILDLERQLATLKSMPEEQQAASEELLKSLKAQLREYESCTATLELETEHLRAKLKVLNELIANVEQNEHVNIADKLSSAQRESDTATHILERQHQAEEQLALIARADTVERAVPAILHWLCLHGLDCAVFIRDALEKQYWCSTDGRPVDGAVRQLLQSIGPGADSFWTETKRGAIFVGSVLRICVQNPGLESSDRYEAKDDLTMPLQIIDALLRSLTETRKSGKHLAASLGQHLDAAMTQHKFLLDETTRIADQLYEELPQYLRNLELTRVQKECLDGMVEDFKSDLHLLARAGGSVEHALKTAALALSRQRTA